MKQTTRRAFLAVVTGTICSGSFAQDLAVHGEAIYPVSADVIENGVVLIKDGKIVDVGPAHEIQIPAGAEELSAAVVTPGLIDAHTVVGLAGYLGQPQDQQQIDHSSAIQPELRAIDAYNSRDRLVGWLREHGITTIHTGHAPGETISGQTMVVKTVDGITDEHILKAPAMVAATFGDGVGLPGPLNRKSSASRSRAMATLRSEFVTAREKAATSSKNGDVPGLEARASVLQSILNREIPLLVTAHRHQDIVSAIRFAKEFNVEVVLDGAAEAYLVSEQIKDAEIPVIIHPATARPFLDMENISFTTANDLMDAGVDVVLQSGYEPVVPKTHVVLFEASVYVQYGMPAERAIAAMTLDAAKLLGVDDRVGSIEIGKDGDLALFDGDPLEYTSHVVGTVINGVLVSDSIQ